MNRVRHGLVLLSITKALPMRKYIFMSMDNSIHSTQAKDVNSAFSIIQRRIVAS